ncbi:MAG: Fic family protein [Nanoarchaeota archaeon]|nr:Fic family protein [Nanoarchaeota archaeon]MBU1030910.1 Fic family protein [Nanoarchaeota archaeon]MBU1850697.1 Fic family protein [Nanoarchaeota archaeon]
MDVIVRVKRGKKYYYLEHSYRFNNKVKLESRYLGSKIPDNIEKLKAEFIEKVNQKVWFDDLNKIKKNFSKEFESFPKSAKKKYVENFLIKFTYNTQRIEGGTLTLKETVRLLEEGITPRNKPFKDVKETEAHKVVFESMLKETEDLSLKLMLKWHKQLFETVDLEIAGIIRNHPIAIAGSKFEPPQPVELDYLLRKFFQWYNNNKNKIYILELAALIHLKVVTIHPFTDGNGRISRLLMNFILNRNGFPMLNIEYSNRAAYYNALEKSQTKELDRIFVMYLIKRYLKEYTGYVK